MRLEVVIGGWSQAYKLFLRRLLINSLRPKRAGIPVRIGRVWHVIFTHLADSVTDGDGHKQALEWVGAAGLKPCFIHGNVFSKNSRMVDANNVTITCHELDRFALNNHAGLYRNAAIMVGAHGRHAAGEMSLGNFERLRKATGAHNHVARIAC